MKMLNNVNVMGRITKDLEVKITNSGVKYVIFTLACDNGKTRDGKEVPATFIECIAWRTAAETLEKYSGKGRLLLIDGRLDVSSYKNKEGQSRTTTRVTVEQMYMLDRGNNNASKTEKTEELKDLPIEESLDDFSIEPSELPFY